VKEDRLTQVQIRSDTKDRLATFKEVAVKTYDDAINYLIGLVLQAEDEGSVARAGLRVRQAREKAARDLGNQKGHVVFRSGPIAVSATP